MDRSCAHVTQPPSNCKGGLKNTKRWTCSCWLAKGDGRGTGPEQARAAALALATQERMLALCGLPRLARRASSEVGEFSLPCAPNGSPLCPAGLYSKTCLAIRSENCQAAAPAAALATQAPLLPMCSVSCAQRHSIAPGGAAQQGNLCQLAQAQLLSSSTSLTCQCSSWCCCSATHQAPLLPRCSMLCAAEKAECEMGKLVQSAHAHVPFSVSGRGEARAGLTVEVLRRKKSSTRRRRSRPQPALYTGRFLERMRVFKACPLWGPWLRSTVYGLRRPYSFWATSIQSQHLLYGLLKPQGMGWRPETTHLGGLLLGDDSCVTRDDALVLKEVPGLGASLDCASALRRSLHPPSLQCTLPSWQLTARHGLQLRPRRGDRKDGLTVLRR